MQGPRRRYFGLRDTRLSGITLLASAVLVLLPALAWLQYSWLDQIADADRERRERTLDIAAAQLARDFEGELAKAVGDLQIEAPMVEAQSWSGYAARYQTWADTALAPEMIKAVYFVPAPESGSAAAKTPVLRAWNAATTEFEETSWPPELASIRLRFMADNHHVDIQGPRRGFPPAPLGDEQTIVVPVMRMVPSPPLREPLIGGPGLIPPPPPPNVRVLGFTVLRLEPAVLGRDVLPALVRRHLYDDRGHTDFVIGVVARDDPTRVIFESGEGAARTALDNPDVSTSLLGARIGTFMMLSREGRRGLGGGERQRAVDSKREGARADTVILQTPRPPGATDEMVVNVVEARRSGDGASVQTRVFNASEGHWRLVAKHRAGSLEAAVAAARTRNVLLSSGVLMLLAAAIGLIVVSARRADRLARQQLEFVAAVSHELRTPVSVIGAAAGNLADGVVGEPARVKKYGETIQTEARRLGETVERVLQLAGIAVGRGAAAADATLPTARLIEDALSASRHEIESAGATVEVEIAADLPSVTGDATALRSAIRNLISNGLKYGGAARWLRVKARRKPARAGLDARHALGRATIEILIEDRGLGIPVEERKHIFEPFYRGREAVSRQIQGSGLGLHLVRRIIDAHGGAVSVQSEPGRGSTFIIELPAADVSTAAAAVDSLADARS